jgi:[acyl-carrier-protein] S-malonyltransferase
MNVVFMFPSQSSRYAGMIRKLVALRPAARQVLADASAELGEDLESRYLRDGADVFAEKRDQRLGLFLVNYMYQRVLEAEGVTARYSLGFSLGEYNHLVHIGALAFADALRILVRPSPPDLPDPVGERAVVYRIPLAPLAALVERAREHGVIQIGGMLSPHIHYIAGESEPVRWVCARLKEELPESRSMYMPVKLPLHSLLMRPIAERLAEFLAGLELRVPRLPYLPNALGELVDQPDKATLVDLMTRHLYQAMHWRQSIDSLVRRHRDAVFVEVGPRRALCAFFYLEKKWHPQTRYHITDNMDANTAAYLEKIVAELGPRRGIFAASRTLHQRLGVALD